MVATPTTYPNFGIPQGLRPFVRGGAGTQLIHELFATPWSFASLCEIITIEDEVTRLRPTRLQRQAVHAAALHRFVWAGKGRQSFISTIFAMLMLRDCMFGEGIQGAVVAQKEETHRDLMRRIIFAHDRMRRNPVLGPTMPALKEGTKATLSGIEFEHGGGIWPITAGSSSPGVGRSFTRVHESELCEMAPDDFQRLQDKFYPPVNKRPNGRVWRESTPGKANTPQHRAWLNTLKGNTRFHPVFLKWWEDDYNTIPDMPIELSAEEEAFVSTLSPRPSVAHVAFRRVEIATFCDNDPSKFETKYPSRPTAGWAAEHDAVFDANALAAMQTEAVGDPKLNEAVQCHILTRVNSRRQYVVLADPADFGAKGDNSALVVFDRHSGEEVAFWEGREDPNLFYARCKKVCRYYNDAEFVPESNCSAVVALAVADEGEDATNLFYEKADKPGWRATARSLQIAEAATNKLLRDGSLRLRAASTVIQLASFDGQARRRRVTTARGEQSHYDRARCVVMAADYLDNGGFLAELTDEELAERREAERLAHAAAKQAAFIDNLKRLGRYVPPQNTSAWDPDVARRAM